MDDGKSTLIGRLLYDSDSISTDIIETLTRQSKAKNQSAGIDLALLTDGLRAEREQGITIDVAYKYFSTAKRKFIIADTPGHIQYTRNMFTGASNADLAIILVDARNGVTEQTKRHSVLSAILGVPRVLVCVNKIDMVDYSEEVYRRIEAEYQAFAGKLGIRHLNFIPTSALAGDNVVNPSERMPWYSGKTLLNFLESMEIHDNEDSGKARFQVQYVIRPQTAELHDYRGFAGQVSSGAYRKGQQVVVLPSGIQTQISAIEHHGTEVEEAVAKMPVVLHLKDQIDVSRGNTIVPADSLPQTAKEIQAVICWMDTSALVPGQKVILQQNSFRTRAVVKDLHARIDIHSYDELPPEGPVTLNDICRVTIKTAEPLSFDAYRHNRHTGAFILIHENTNNTIAAGTIS